MAAPPLLTLQDVAPDDSVVDVTAGFLRASLRAVDPEDDPAVTAALTSIAR